jgi:hypothetical protein
MPKAPASQAIAKIDNSAWLPNEAKFVRGFVF